MARDTRIASRLRRVGLYLIDDVTILTYLIVFVIVVTVSGILYHCLTPLGHGIGRDSSPLSETSFRNGIYLSLVTVSSLGYSDMHPIGFSKAIACFEVLMGMILSGVFIAKLASHRLSFHVSRIYGSYTRDFLDDMSETFDDIATKIRRWGSEYSTKYERITIANGGKIETVLIRGIEEIAGDIDSHIKSLLEYVDNEVNQTDYFQNAPTRSIVRLGNSSNSMFYILGQILIGLSPQSRIDMLETSVRSKISNASRTMLEISSVVIEHKGASERPEVRNAFKGVGRVCSSIPRMLGEAPEQFTPDQIDWATDDPSPFKEDDDESATMQ